jgi:hypothetical protein
VRRAGARVVAVALGSEDGASVPDAGVPLRDPHGDVVLSRRDAERLARWSEDGDGALVVADRWGGIDLAGAMAAIRRDAGRADGEPVARRVAATRVAPFAALAFALLWLELLPVPLFRRARLLAFGAALAAAFAAGAPRARGDEPHADPTAALEARLRVRPADAELLVALARARAEHGDAAEAARALRAAALLARDPALAALAWYDVGVLALERRARDPEGGAVRSLLVEARDAFLESLALAPDDREARFNLEWTLRALEAEPPPASGERRPPDAGEPPPEPEAAEERAPAPDPAAAERGRSAPALERDEVERWLEAAVDDAGRGLRRAAREEPRRPAPGVPRW